MKQKSPILKRINMLLMATFLITTISKSATFTAVSSGNWSNAATWGISAPSFLNTGDQIIIPSGINVVLDNNLDFNGLLTQLTVNGTLTASPVTSLIITNGTLSGSGSIEADNLILGTGAVVTFDGSLKARTITNSAPGIQTAADIIVEESLILSGGAINIPTGGQLTMNSNSIVRVNGGVLNVNGGSIMLTPGYSVEYNSGNALGGRLLQATGLKNLTVDVGSGNSLTLEDNLTVEGLLTLSSGMMELGTNDLTLKGDIATTNGGLSGTASSDLFLLSPTGFSGFLNFNGGSGTVNNLTVNVGTSNRAEISGNLAVNGTLEIISGTLHLNSANIHLNGNIGTSGNGQLYSGSLSSVSVSTVGSPSGVLTFAAGGRTVKDLTINISDGGSAVLGSDLTVTGNLILTRGRLDIDGSKLQIASGATISGGNSSSYIATGMSGVLSLQHDGPGTKTYPVGTATDYFPATIKLNTGSPGGWINVGVENNVYTYGTYGYDMSANQHLVDATWMVTSDISSNLNVDLRVMWSSTSEVNGFARSSSFISHHSNNKWDVQATGAATAESDGMFSHTRTGITSLSPFAVFDQTTSEISEIRKNVSFIIYPNPSNETISFTSLSGISGPANVDIINSRGQIIGTYNNLSSINNSIPVQDLQNGYYTLRLYNNKINSFQRFIKN